MKIPFLLLFYTLFFFSSACLFAQIQPAIAWQKTLGGPGNDIIEDIYPTSDGNYILFALADSSGGDVAIDCQPHGIHDIWIFKMDPTGNIIWQKCFGGSKEEGNPYSKIIQTSDGGYLFITESWSSDFDVEGHHAYSDAWTVKLDADGNLLWAKSFGGYIYDVPRNIYELLGQKYMLLSRTTSSDGDVPPSIDSVLSDAWVFIIDDEGNIVTNKIYGGTGDDSFFKALPAADGNIALFGLTSSTDGDLAGMGVDSTDGWMLIIDTVGNIVSGKVYGGPNIEYFFDALNTPDGGYIAFGETGDPAAAVENGYWHGDQDYWAVKLAADGSVQWQGIYGGTEREQFRRAMALPDNSGFMLAGSTNSFDGDIINNTTDSARDWWILQIDENGVIYSSVALGGTGSDFAYAIAEPGIVVGGTFSDDGDVVDLDGTADGWVIQLSYATGIPSSPEYLQTLQVFPNPANSTVKLQMDDDLQPMRIEVRNALGQLKHTLSEFSETATINVTDWVPGLYFIVVSLESVNTAPLIRSFEVVH